MPGYVKEALLEFQHPGTNEIKFNSPSPYTPPVYGRKQQMAKIDETNPINKRETKLLQQVCGKFLYYARAIDTTMLHALNDLATQTTEGTEKTMEALAHFLNYCATHPDAEIIFRASDMVIHNHSDAAYLVASEARSRAGGFTYMGNHKGNLQIINGAILVIAKIIKSVMSSAAEAEIGALFMNAKAIIPLRITCEELGHKQPATPMRTDNNTAEGIMNGTIKQNRSCITPFTTFQCEEHIPSTPKSGPGIHPMHIKLQLYYLTGTLYMLLEDRDNEEKQYGMVWVPD
ncbi:hypothetical protein FRACYDRAFT_233801 [Fragilariopsis cylindrus CCMP1102]|uniref:Uncharacterized protein n=1 Tax=Fragilariopsis cylindrus CCMP1102 TaxID=635003 RepID=A0A1E7FZQ3_9STRA|nr:hypothetical protein FRACYDRAFT_233801 [Fragilariopsis cylindrus CCMP1102]|eukprot:OEU23630.1 hypothetical protein FRACYDRAFT_233801 [Fragilariopsis cylindrus CCMP1102]